MRSPPRLVAILFVIVAMISIQLGAVLAKQIFPVITPLGTASLRLFFAAILVCGALRPWRYRLSAPAVRAVLVYGVALGGMNSLFYASINRIPLGVATALEIIGPLTVAVLASRRAIDFLWIALAVAGLALLLPIGEAVRVDPLGAALAMGAGGCWAMYIVFGQRAGAEHGLQTTAVGLAIAAACVLPLALWQVGPSLFTPAVLPLALGVAILSAALPYSLEMVALGRLPSRAFGMLMSLQPALAALSGLALLDERLSSIQWLAIALVIIASAATAVTGGDPEKPLPVPTEVPSPPK